MEDAVWIIAERPQEYGRLCTLASSFGGPVRAVWVGDEEDLPAVCTCGAAEVLFAPCPSGGLYEDALGSVLAAFDDERPKAVLLASTKRLRLAAAQFGAACGARPINDATLVEVEDGAVITERMVYGGSAYSRERIVQACAIVLASEGLLGCASAIVADAEAPVRELGKAASSPFALVGCEERQVDSVNLACAKRIVSIGRGLKSEDDLSMVRDLAAAMQAEIGCTRPLAEGEQWLARERYIGVSGVMASPEVFVACGLSGQVQHMVGASGARTIIAINKDKDAPLFKYADYGIIGDIYEVLPALTKALA